MVSVFDAVYKNGELAVSTAKCLAGFASLEAIPVNQLSLIRSGVQKRRSEAERLLGEVSRLASGSEQDHLLRVVRRALGLWEDLSQRVALNDNTYSHARYAA
ncbi:MAG: hypothetical protein KF874_06850 [Rhizobiaceae bacterium]|nr:hypothetical protein [Rhizobiaceae bacterium]